GNRVSVLRLRVRLVWRDEYSGLIPVFPCFLFLVEAYAMPRVLLVRSRNYRRRRPGFRPLEMELLEARLPPGEGILGFLLAAAWLEPSIAVVDPDLTPPVRDHDSFSRESEMSAEAATPSTDTAEQSRGTSSHLLTASAQRALGTLDDDSLWVWPSTIPSAPLQNLDSRDADRIFAAGALNVGMPMGP